MARAKQLLAEAGYPNGISVELWTSNERVGLQELAVAVQQMAAPAGIKLEVKTVPWAVFNSTVYKKKSLYVNNWFGRGTIDETLYAYFRTGGGWNEGEFSKPELDRMLDEGRSTVDMEKRKKIYAQAQQFIHDEGHMVGRVPHELRDGHAEQRQGLHRPPAPLLRLPLDVPGGLSPVRGPLRPTAGPSRERRAGLPFPRA